MDRNRLPIGKHKGWLIHEVMVFCPSYVQWLYSTNSFEIYDEERALVETLLFDEPEDLFILEPLRCEDTSRFINDVVIEQRSTSYVFTRGNVFKLYNPLPGALDDLKTFLRYFPSEDNAVYAEFESSMRKRKNERNKLLKKDKKMQRATGHTSPFK